MPTAPPIPAINAGEPAVLVDARGVGDLVAAELVLVKEVVCAVTVVVLVPEVVESTLLEVVLLE